MTYLFLGTFCGVVRFIVMTGETAAIGKSLQVLSHASQIRLSLEKLKTVRFVLQGGATQSTERLKIG